MSICAYLKKDIDWIGEDKFSGPFLRAEEALKEKGLSVRKFKNACKDQCLFNWDYFTDGVVKNNDRDVNNHQFSTDESFEKALKYDWIIPMDDDDNIRIFIFQLNEIKHSDVVIYKTYEYDFVKGKDRSSSYLSREDTPFQELERNKNILLPSCYAISSGAAKRILDLGLVHLAVNFHTALDMFEELEMKISYLPDRLTSRPYTHFSEYYLFDPTIKEVNPIYDYREDIPFFNSIRKAYESCQ